MPGAAIYSRDRPESRRNSPESLRAAWFGDSGERGIFRRATSGITDLIYPRRCAATGRRLPTESAAPLHPDAFDALPWIGANRCARCSSPSPRGIPSRNSCPDCRGKSLRFSGAAAAWLYEPPVSEWIKSLKFHGRIFLIPMLASATAEAVLSTGLAATVDIVIAVPVRSRIFRHRGFNQSALIAERIARMTGKVFAGGVLEKLRDTEPQATLSRKEREKNLAGAFAVRRPSVLKGRVALVVDDVMTTCATVSECARVCLAAGARSVYAAAVARSTRLVQASGGTAKPVEKSG